MSYLDATLQELASPYPQHTGLAALDKCRCSKVPLHGQLYLGESVLKWIQDLPPSGGGDSPK